MRGDQFASQPVAPENKALRIDDTNDANNAQAMRFARTDDQRREIKLAGLRSRLRSMVGREREQEIDNATEPELERLLAEAQLHLTTTEEATCSDSQPS